MIRLPAWPHGGSDNGGSDGFDCGNNDVEDDDDDDNDDVDGNDDYVICFQMNAKAFLKIFYRF